LLIGSVLLTTAPTPLTGTVTPFTITQAAPAPTTSLAPGVRPIHYGATITNQAPAPAYPAATLGFRYAVRTQPQPPT
jgi:hypothetical protein